MQITHRNLRIEPLTAKAFRPFGDVIEANQQAFHFPINNGRTERYHDLARVDVATGGGHAIVNIFRGQPCLLPMRLLLLERHPLGSQAFMPLSPQPFLVVVAQAAPEPDLVRMRCFQAAPGQGVNYALGTWHHPLLALHAVSDFLVVDRGGGADEAHCDEYNLTGVSCWLGKEQG